MNRGVNMAKFTLEERARSYKEFIIKYLSKENWHDYENIAKLQDYPTIKKLEAAEKFILENMSDQTYADFLKKAYPLEQYGKEELKEKLVKLATDINYGRAGLIEILDTVGNLQKYAYMVKHLRFKYGLIGATVYQANLVYIDSVSLYNHADALLTNSYTNLSEKEELALREIVREKGLYLNNATYRAAYIHARTNGIIKVNPPKR